MTTATLTAENSSALNSRLKTRWLALGVAAASFVLLFLIWPYQHWQFASRGSILEGWYKVLTLDANAEWQFCFLVPVIVGVLVYRQRAELRALPLSGSWLGAWVLAFGMVLYWLGYKVDTGYLGFAAIQVSVAGLILLLAGKSWMKALFLPWVFLAFAWPLFPMDTIMAGRLKIPTAQVAGILTHAIGIDVVREGSTIQSAADFAAGIKQGEKFTLDVSDSCSGMRSLYALIMVGVLYSFIALKGSMPRLILSLSTIPLAIAGNVVRLLLLAVGCLVFGQETAIGRNIDGNQEESFYHLFAGYVVFGVALAGMFALATLLEGKHWKKVKLWSAAKQQDGVSIAQDHLGSTLKKALVVVGLTMGGVGLCLSTPSRPNLADSGFKLELPAEVGNYQSRSLEMSAMERANFDEGVVLKRREYGSPAGRRIIGTMVVSGVLKKTLHPPEICLPNQGWIVAETREVPVRLPNGLVLTANLMRIFRDFETAPGHRVRVKALNLYWYEGSDGTRTPNYTLSNVISYSDAIFLNLNHRWSQVAFFMPLPEQEIGMDNPLEEIGAIQELTEFVGEAAPAFMMHQDH